MREKIDQHGMICKLKDLAISLGRTPTRNEFRSSVDFGSNHINALFGDYAALVQAAGLDPVGRRRLTNEIFERDIREVQKEFVPRQPIESFIYEPTLFIGDTHFPWVLQRVLDQIYKFAQKHQPVRIIQVGDLYDMYAHTKFPRSQNIYSPEQEEGLAIAGATEMWKTLRSICPDAECVQIKGNHDIRPVKRTIESLPALEHVVSKHLNQIMTFDGVKLIADHREEYIFQGVQVIHGYKSGLGEHRDYTLMNTVHGHTHKGGVLYRKLKGQYLWEMDCGLVGDPESKVMGYTPQKITNEITGFGWLDEYGPRFIAVP